MTQQTTNYQLKKYDATDKPDLTDQYNKSMDTIDTKLKEATNQAWSASSKVDQNTAKLNALGVTDSSAAKVNKDKWDKASTDATTALQKVNSLPSAESQLPAGMKAFCTALGLDGSNGTTYGRALNHILNRTPASEGNQYTAKNLADTKITEEGFPFVSTTVSSNEESE